MTNPYRNLFGALTVMGLAYVYANRARFKQLAEDLELDVYIRNFMDGFRDNLNMKTYDPAAEWNAFIDEAMKAMHDTKADIESATKEVKKNT